MLSDCPDARTAQAYSVVDSPSGHSLFGRPHFVECCERAQRDLLNSGLSHGEMCQLHQWSLWVTERGEAWPRLSLGLSERCRLAFCLEQVRALASAAG